MKNKRDFVREYRKATFPYKEIISLKKDLRNALFAEFITTKPKHCFELYLLDPYKAKHYTAKQLNDGLNKANKKLPRYKYRLSETAIAAPVVKITRIESRILKINREFKKKVDNNTLDAKYYCFDLEATNTVKTLNEIAKVIELFKKVLITHNITDYDTEAKHTSKTVLSLIESLDCESLSDSVFKELINGKDNFIIQIKGGNNQSNLKDNYSRLKMYFDNYLKEGYRSNKKNDAEETKETSKAIYINEKIILELHKSLAPKFINSEALLKLLKGHDITELVQFKFKALLLCKIFKYLHELSLIGNTEEETKHWLIKNISTTEKKKPKTLKAPTVEQYFKLRQIDAPIPELAFLNSINR